MLDELKKDLLVKIFEEIKKEKNIYLLDEELNKNKNILFLNIYSEFNKDIELRIDNHYAVWFNFSQGNDYLYPQIEIYKYRSKTKREVLLDLHNVLEFKAFNFRHEFEDSISFESEKINFEDVTIYGDKMIKVYANEFKKVILLVLKNNNEKIIELKNQKEEEEKTRKNNLAKIFEDEEEKTRKNNLAKIFEDEEEKIKYSVVNEKFSYIYTDNDFLYNLFGLEDGNEINLSDDLECYIYENILDGVYTDDEIELIREFQKVINKELQNNDVVKVLKK